MELSLTNTNRIERLIQKLKDKAKSEPNYRFYSLWDKAISYPNLTIAYELSRRNNGAGGVDGISYSQIEKYGIERYLMELAKDLQNKTYKPRPLKVVRIPKEDGTMRRLGIPTIRDCVAQGAVKQIIEGIFEQDFLECSYAYIHDRGAGQAVNRLKELLEAGYTHIYQLDINKFFDSIPHSIIMREVGRRIQDKTIMYQIQQWLKAPLQESKRPPRKNKAGTAQGGVISPLLANIVLNRFDQVCVGEKGIKRTLDIQEVRYADDIIILSKKPDSTILQKAEEAICELGLSLNKNKTKTVALETGVAIEYLGYELRNDKGQVRVYPSEKAIKGAKGRIRELTKRSSGKQDIIKELEQYIRGWETYYSQSTEREGLEGIKKYAQEMIGQVKLFSTDREYIISEYENALPL